MFGLADVSLFKGTEVWEKDDGACQPHFEASPVVYLSMCTAKGDTREQFYGAPKDMFAVEDECHVYLSDSFSADSAAAVLFDRMRMGATSESDYAGLLLHLAHLLHVYQNYSVVLLIDECDAPVMVAYSVADGGYSREIAIFLKRLLAVPLKDGGGVLALVCLVGAQRITRESISSDLNSVTVSIALFTVSGEYFGFTNAEMVTFAPYLGCADCVDEDRRWYDGHRLGSVGVFNLWSALSYFGYGRAPDVYWGGTSSNSVAAGLVRRSSMVEILCPPSN